MLADELHASDLAELIQRLRIADRQFRVFGSKEHRYRLGKVLSAESLASFESAKQVKLPDDYRNFLATVGNGCAGPFYGLEPLEKAAYRDLSKPFRLTQATDEFADEECESFGDRDEYPGILEFCHQGCAIYSYLVVNGPTYGTIWDGREDFYPTGLTFAAWYREWAERAIRSLENEKLVPLIRVGMSKAEVLSRVGGDWRERDVRFACFFEASEIPAQLELDQHGVVTKINPWPFISASPRYKNKEDV